MVTITTTCDFCGKEIEKKEDLVILQLLQDQSNMKLDLHRSCAEGLIGLFETIDNGEKNE